MAADAPVGLAICGVSLCIPLVYRHAETQKPATKKPSHKFISLLENADWFLHGGEQVALCGPSGCGKTSLLNVLAGLEKPVSGSIRWDNIEITSITAQQQDTWRRNQLGLVFQQFHLFPYLSALENVLLPARFTAIRPSAAQYERAQSLLARVGVRPNDDIAVLSRGEQQRVAVARALLSSPLVVLADEPTASLDNDTARTIASMLQELCREQRAALIVATHDREIASTFDAIYDMANGKITLRDISQ
jgi:putative ABC transport system ATP-binding protein